MRLAVLSSGSGGNCLWVEAGGARVLVDAGLSLKVAARRASLLGIRLEEATHLLVTHEHADHAGCAGVYARKLGVKVHATRGTFLAMRDAPPAEQRFVASSGEPIALSPSFLAIPWAVPHDAEEPVVFAFEERLPDGAVARAAIVTDLGRVPAALPARLGPLDAAVIELNHDPELLQNGPYPERLKRRISAGRGHLSNAQGASLAAALSQTGLCHLVLAHLSETNNRPELALQAARQALDAVGASPTVLVGSQGSPLPLIDVLPRSPEPAVLPMSVAAARPDLRTTAQLSLW